MIESNHVNQIDSMDSNVLSPINYNNWMYGRSVAALHM